MRTCLRCGLIAFMVLSSPALAPAKGLSPPSAPDPARIAQFLECHRDVGLVTIQDWLGLDVRYREGDGGLSGKMIEIIDVCVQDRAELEAASTVFAEDGPRFRLKDIEVRVLSDGDERRFRRKDLRWMEMTSRGDGVYILDGTIASAMIPGIRIGDRIRVVREYDLKGIFGLPPHSLGSALRPSLECGYEIRLPESYTLVWTSRGVESDRVIHTEQAVDGRLVNLWRLAANADGTLPVCRDRYPVARITPHVRHAGDHHRDDITCGAGWEQTGNAYLQLIDGLCDPDDEIVRHVADITADLHDPMDMIDRIYADVQDRCRYLGLFEGTGDIIPVPATKVYELGFGDCKGLGALLISMLRAAGIPAHPVLVATSSAGRLTPDIPNMSQFNHFIVWADNGRGGLFLDGTVDACPAGLVPVSDAASPVLLLRPGAVGLIEIPDDVCDPGDERLTVDGRLDSDGHLNLEIAYTATENLGVGWRSYLSSLDSRDLRKRILESLLPDGMTAPNKAITIIGLEDVHVPLVMRIKATSSRPQTSSGTTIYLQKDLIPLNRSFDPAVDCDTVLDLRRFPRRYLEWSMELPEGYVLKTPEDSTVESEELRMKHRIWQDGRILKLEEEFLFLRDSVSADEIDILRDAIRQAAPWRTGYIEIHRPETE